MPIYGQTLCVLTPEVPGCSRSIKMSGMKEWTDTEYNDSLCLAKRAESNLHSIIIKSGKNEHDINCCGNIYIISTTAH